MTIAGLKLIVPTSVAGSGVSVSASGKVTFTAATSVSVNGCFTSSYDNYLAVIRFNVSAQIGLNFRLRASGTDNSTANSYVSQYISANAASVTGARTTSNQISDFLFASATQRCGAHMYFYGPNLVQPTAGRTVVVQDLNSAFLTDTAYTHNQSTAYDGFTLSVTSNNATGALTIYGLSQ
jgi:hypothetical protein